MFGKKKKPQEPVSPNEIYGYRLITINPEGKKHTEGISAVASAKREYSNGKVYSYSFFNKDDDRVAFRADCKICKIVGLDILLRPKK